MTTWTTPRTWTSEVMSSATLNTHLRDNLNHLYENLDTDGWNTYTPTFTGLTVGNGTLTAKYAYAGRTTLYRIALTFGSTTSISGSVTVTYPATANMGSSFCMAETLYVDTGTATYKGIAVHNSTTTMVLYALLANGTYVSTTALSSGVPFTWTTGDVLTVIGFNERAS